MVEIKSVAPEVPSFVIDESTDIILSSILDASIEVPIPHGKYPAKQHARNVAARLPDGPGLIYLEGQVSKLFEDSDMPPRFRQRRYFQYLSGVTDIPDCVLVYSLSTDALGLFIPPLKPATVLWSGMPLSPDECTQKYDVDYVLTTSDVRRVIIDLLAGNFDAPVYTIHNQRSFVPDRASVNAHLLQTAIDDCRVYKDAYEIELLRRANVITAAAHVAVMQGARKARNESELEALHIAVCTAKMAKNQAYDPIVGSGRNAATLHYVRNNECLEGRQLLLNDSACEVEGYAADVTRTFPLSGEWTKEARAVHEIVAEMQRETVKISVPGVDWRETHLLAHRLATRGLLRLGILHNGTEDEIFNAGTSKAFYPHGLGHFIGLEVHDVEGTKDGLTTLSLGPYSTLSAADPTMSPHIFGRNVSYTLINRMLARDMVITVEPGIYFCEFIIRPYLKDPVHGKYINEKMLDRYWDVGGVRIEDDYVITEDGNECITTAPAGEKMMRIVRGEECKATAQERCVWVWV